VPTTKLRTENLSFPNHCDKIGDDPYDGFSWKFNLLPRRTNYIQLVWWYLFIPCFNFIQTRLKGKMSGFQEIGQVKEANYTKSVGSTVDDALSRTKNGAPFAPSCNIGNYSCNRKKPIWKWIFRQNMLFFFFYFLSIFLFQPINLVLVTLILILNCTIILRYFNFLLQLSGTDLSILVYMIILSGTSIVLMCSLFVHFEIFMLFN